MLDTLTHESFEPHIGTPFAIHAAGQEEVLTLAEVRAGQLAEGFDRVPFVLTFHSERADGHYESELFELTHAELGPLYIMISPSGRNADGTYRYEAVFS